MRSEYRFLDMLLGQVLETRPHFLIRDTALVRRPSHRASLPVSAAILRIEITRPCMFILKTLLLSLQMAIDTTFMKLSFKHTNFTFDQNAD